jgi:hypothetical protein
MALALIKICLTDKRMYQVTGSALVGADALGLDEKGVAEFIIKFVKDEHFHESYPSNSPPGDIFDVYKTDHEGKKYYIKFKFTGTKDSIIRIVSFKENTDGKVPRRRPKSRRRV